MNRTITINISGVVFHIEEDAYAKLKSYLTKISTHFNNQEGGSKIISDIESRIAELLNQRITLEQNAVNEPLIDEVIAIIGLPKDFSEESYEKQSENKQQPTPPNFYSKRNRHLYRDPDSRVFGGVCSGLALYFNSDKILMRVIAIILFIITSGAALPVYIILWIAVPQACTNAQRSEMKGESVNIENSNENDTNNSGNQSNNTNRGSHHTRNYTNSNTGNVVEKVFGAIFIAIGFLSLFGLSIGIFASTKMIGFLPGFFPGINNDILFDHIFSSEFISTLMISGIIILGIPILLIIYAGTKMLFNYISNNRSIILSALGIWILGIIIAVSTITGAVKSFKTEASVSDENILNGKTDTLYISLNEDAYQKYSSSKFELNNIKVLEINGKDILVASPTFSVEKSGNSSSELNISKTSKGNSLKSAKKNAEQIDLNYTIDGSKLILDPYFTIEENGKWRNQKCNITLKIPDEKVIFLSESLLSIIHNIDNTSNMWIGDMVNHYWIMKPEGLTFLK
jgi:phage shock protein PspC (stress-responsive transcriptional regulator)